MEYSIIHGITELLPHTESVYVIVIFISLAFYLGKFKEKNEKMEKNYEKSEKRIDELCKNLMKQIFKIEHTMQSEFSTMNNELKNMRNDLSATQKEVGSIDAQFHMFYKMTENTQRKLF